jgi:hypothetical protein
MRFSGLVHTHPAALDPPAVVGVVRYPDLIAGPRQCRPYAQGACLDLPKHELVGVG